MANTAQDSFIYSIEEAQLLLQTIKDRLDSFLGGEPDPEKRTNVGDAQRLESQLRQIVENS